MPSIRAAAFIVLLLANGNSLAAQGSTIDTTDAHLASGTTIAAAALITTGLFTFRDDGFLSRGRVQDFRNEFFPEFENDFDDISQYVPAVLALGLSAAGVPGRHTLGRAAATYGTELILQTLLVHAAKAPLDIERPDGSAKNAFPSGHTTTAFGAATFLHKEYGSRSAYYSIGGYSLAAATGLYRVLNNRHWISDVLVGAGIGILSTELAYLIVDEIAGDRGVNPVQAPRVAEPGGNPSFAGFRFGYARQIGDLPGRDDAFAAEHGFEFGLEGAYFFNRYLGVGAAVSLAGFSVDESKLPPPSDSIFLIADELTQEPIGVQSVLAGPFVNLPLGERFAFSGKLTAGLSQGATSEVEALIKEELQDSVGASEVTILRFEPRTGFVVAAGGSVRAMLSDLIGLEIFGSYNYSRPEVVVSSFELDPAATVQPDPTPVTEKVSLDYFSIGAMISVMIR